MWTTKKVEEVWLKSFNELVWFRASSIVHLTPEEMEDGGYKIVAHTLHGDYDLSAVVPKEQIEEMLDQVMESIVGHEI